jgi:hypothetical protein
MWLCKYLLGLYVVCVESAHLTSRFLRLVMHEVLTHRRKKGFQLLQVVQQTSTKFAF